MYIKFTDLKIGKVYKDTYTGGKSPRTTWFIPLYLDLQGVDVYLNRNLKEELWEENTLRPSDKEFIEASKEETAFVKLDISKQLKENLDFISKLKQTLEL